MSLLDAADSLKRPAETIERWETGAGAPTYRQLEQVARVYKRPVAVFFFPAPPAEVPLKKRFRTLPAAEVDRLHPDTLYALREARSWQIALPELTTGIGDLPVPLPVRLQARETDDLSILATRVRTSLGVSIGQQALWRSNADAINGWRSALEANGVFIFKRPFKQKDVSGFCLDDQRFPIIVLNNGTAHARQVFTLFHELGHLLFGVSGITGRTDPDLNSLDPESRTTEIACNRFAAEFLLPAASFPWGVFADSELGSAVPDVAVQFRVSREVVLRRLLDSERISQATYEQMVEGWAQDYFGGPAGGGGGSYYANQGTYWSDTFLRAAFYQYHAGNITVGDLADRLGMKAETVTRFEDYLLKRTAG